MQNILNMLNMQIRIAQIVAAWQRENGERMRKWRENEKMKRKWRENEEVERNSLSRFPHFLFISSLSVDFLYQKL